MPRGGVAGSHGKHIFHFIRNCQTALQSGWTIFHPHQQCIGVPVILFPLQHLVTAGLSDFRHSSGCVAVSHCVLISVSLITNDVEHLMCLGIIRIFSFGKCLFKYFVHFKLFLSILCIFYTSTLPQIHVL